MICIIRGGTVVAFEMGPPFKMLHINKRYNLKSEYSFHCFYVYLYIFMSYKQHFNS